MKRNTSIWIVLGFCCLQAVRTCLASDDALRIIVMDPLAEPLSCACVKGHGQRKYDQLAKFLEIELGQRVELVFDESLKLARSRTKGKAHLVIGKKSVVEFDARNSAMDLRPIDMLTGRDGKTDLTGLLVVRKDDLAKKVIDLKDRHIVLGPVEDTEANAVARDLLRKAGVFDIRKTKTAGSLDAAVFAVVDKEADAAFISDYMPPLLEACGKIERGSLRVIGSTASVPFVCVFATSFVTEDSERNIRLALSKVAKDPQLLDALESKAGFVPLSANIVEWTDWRGPRRDGISRAVPTRLPEKAKVLWSARVTGPALAGIAATRKYVVVPDKDRELTADIMRCFDAKTGAEVWKLIYDADYPLEYTNVPRATPVIRGDHVYLKGALGDLHCVELATGRVAWKLNFYDKFDVDLPKWGTSSPPLLVDGMLIVNPGAKTASLVALNAKTGEVIWKTPGHAAAYSAFVLAEFDGRRQIVGYDCAGLGGWDPKTGQRLWEITPGRRVDYNIGTPVILPTGILVATENNATRFYRFKDGVPTKTPTMLNDDLAPDTCTPVVLDGRVFCSAYGELFCLDLKRDLKTVWSEQRDIFYEHTSLIAGNKRVLVWTTPADLLLLRADTDSFQVVSHLRPFGDDDVESMSHPAVIDSRLYLRNDEKLLCLDIGDANTSPIRSE